MAPSAREVEPAAHAMPHAAGLTPVDARGALLEREIEARERRLAELDLRIEGRCAGLELLALVPAGPRPGRLARLRRHWRGGLAGRIARSGLFAAAWYAHRYADRLNGRDPLDHFISEGLAAGLQPNPFFDPAWYVARHARDAGATAPAFLHYLDGGGRQALAPGPLFDSVAYLAAHDDVAIEADALAHYLTKGLYLGHAITPPRVPRPA